MVEPIALNEFFKDKGGLEREAFMAEFPGSFLLVRAQGEPPGAVFLGSGEGFKLTIGSDEDCDLCFEMDQTLDALHATITFHPGFRGWNIEDHETSFATHVDGQRLSSGRAHLLQDRQLIKPGGGLVQLQFYLAETLWERMHKAGVTSRVRRPTPSPLLKKKKKR